MKKILIIDDDEFLLPMYSAKFKEADFMVEGAKNGEEAIEKTKTFKPDIILVDIVMPNMDGFETIKSLRRVVGKKTKIVALSNLDQRENIEKALLSGADDYIKKADFTPSQILEKVKKYV